MFWKKQPRQKAGAVIRARTLTDLQDATEAAGKLKVNAPLGLMQTPGGPVIYWGGPLAWGRYFLPLATIPRATGSPPGTASVGSGKAAAYYRDNDANVLRPWGYEATIYNWTPSVLVAGRFVICMLIDRDWTVISDACPAT